MDAPLDLLSERAELTPEALALSEPRTTWAQLDRLADERASALTGAAVSAELTPGLDAAVLLHAASRRGVALRPLAREGREPPTAASGGAAHDVAAPEPQGAWTLMSTSGSTGEPRLIPLTIANHVASAVAAETHLSLTPDDRWLACLPMHHVGGLSIFVRAARSGFQVVPVWPFEPEAVIDAAHRHAVTAISLVPAMLRRMLDAGWSPPASLRIVLLGGAPCPPLLLQAALDRGVPIAPTYGMTETCSQVATLLPREVAGHFGSSGRALPGAELRVGRDGRIGVRGEMVSPAVAGSDGWIVTNDLGVIDSERFLSVLGRADDAIITGGEKVIPRTVEEVLLEDPSVAEAAVVGVTDDEWGQRVIAAVTARGGTVPKPDALLGLVGERLAPHMVPKAVVVLDSLPYTGPGKLDRPRLRLLLEEETR